MVDHRNDDEDDTRRRAPWPSRALLDFTTIAGLFALLFALFFLCGVVQDPTL